MTALQAVLGRIQLKRMADWTAARTANAERMWATCSEFTAVRVSDFRCNATCGAIVLQIMGAFARIASVMFKLF